MKLILVRHGETIENVNDTILGQGQGTLSEFGIEQAKKLAQRLKNEKIDVIYSSDLKRAKDTAAEVHKFHPNIPIYYSPELRERDFYNFDGQSVSSIDWDNIQDKIESRESMYGRAKKILDEAYLKYPNDTVLFVGHNGINRSMTALIMNKGAEYMKELEHFKNTSVSVFEIREDKNHKVVLLNSADHLENMAGALVTCFTNPDIDGIACAIGYTEFLNRAGKHAVYKIFGELHTEAKFVIDFLKFKVESTHQPASAFGKIVLVDSSLIQGLDKSIQLDRVTEIIDHCKVNNADKFKKAKIQIEFVGSCATLIAEKLLKREITPIKTTAVLLYSAIVSNTLNFKAKVTTDRDIKMAEWLKSLTDLPDNFVHQMFAAKSDFSGNKLHLAIVNDHIFNHLGKAGVGIGQIEMVDAQSLVDKRKKEIIDDLDKLSKKFKTDINFISIIDIENGYNLLIASDAPSQKLLAKVLGVKFDNNIARREGLIMRKEIAPLLREELQRN